MTEEAALLAAMRERPQEVAPIYADWLDEFTDRHDEAAWWRSELTEEQVMRKLYPLQKIGVKGNNLEHVEQILFTASTIRVPPVMMQLVQFDFAEMFILDRINVHHNSRKPVQVVLWLKDSVRPAAFAMRSCNLICQEHLFDFEGSVIINSGNSFGLSAESCEDCSLGISGSVIVEGELMTGLTL